MKSLLLIPFSLAVAFAACPRELVGQETETTAQKNQAAATTQPSGSSAPRVLAGRQIEIRAQILEVDYEKLKQAGIDWNTDVLSLPAAKNGAAESNGQGAKDQSVIRFGVVDQSDFAALVTRLKSRGVAKMLAKPTVVTADGRPCRIHVVGEERPLLIPQSEGKVSIEFLIDGTDVSATPHILESNRVCLELTLEHSTFGECVKRLHETGVSGGSGIVGDFILPTLTSRKVHSRTELLLGRSLIVAEVRPAEPQHKCLLAAFTPRLLDKAVSDSAEPDVQMNVKTQLRALRHDVQQLRRDVEKLIRLLEARDESQARPAGWNELAMANTRAASEPLVTRVYPITDLLVPVPAVAIGGSTQKQAESQTPPSLDFQTLTNLILGSVSPDTWRQAGGKGWMTPSPDNLALIVRQTRPVHQEIHNLLSQLRRLLQPRKQSRDASDSCHLSGQ